MTGILLTSKVKGLWVKTCSACGEGGSGSYCQQCGGTLKGFSFLPYIILLVGLCSVLFFLIGNEGEPSESDLLKAHSSNTSFGTAPTMDQVEQLMSRRGRNGLMEAVAALDKLVERYPDYNYALRLRANLLADLGRHEPAAEAYKVYLNLNEEDLKVRVAYGMTLMRLERSDMAVQQLEKVVEAAPKYSDGYLLLSRAVQAMGDQTRADQLEKKAVEVKNQYGNIGLPLVMHSRDYE